MSRTVELGRAVVALPSVDLELWLTTLITISPDTATYSAQPQTINLKNLEMIALLDYLSNGDVWVTRGTAMHMTFKLKKLEEPLSRQCLQHLGNSLMNAPAWRQLGHHLSSPLNYDPVDGDLRINISPCRQNGASIDGRDNGVANTHAIGVRPPEGTPIVRLDSVDFVISIFETRDRRALRKRAKRDISRQADNPSKVEEHPYETKFLSTQEYRPRSELETLGFSGPNADHEASDQSYTKSGTQRASTAPDVNASLVREERKRAFTISELPMISMTGSNKSESAQLVGLVDVAVRYSICLGVKGSTLGPKIKASTFVHGLADIAPALWRPGYVSVLSQTVHTNPVIGRSLSRISLSARSIGLKVKLRAASESAMASISKRDQHLAERSMAEKAISDRVWINTLKSQMSKAPPSLVQAFCIPTPIDVIVERSLEVLEERESLDNDSQEHDNVDETTLIRLADLQTRPHATPTSFKHRLCTFFRLNPASGNLTSAMQPTALDPVCHSRETTGPFDPKGDFDCSGNARQSASSFLVADHDDGTQTLYDDTNVGNEELLFGYDEADYTRSSEQRARVSGSPGDSHSA